MDEALKKGTARHFARKSRRYTAPPRNLKAPFRQLPAASPVAAEQEDDDDDSADESTTFVTSASGDDDDDDDDQESVQVNKEGDEEEEEEEDIVQPGQKRMRTNNSFFVREKQHTGVQSQAVVDTSSMSLDGETQEEPPWELLSYEGIPAEERDAVAKYARKCLVKLSPADRKGATPSVLITTLPTKDPRDPIWAGNPCLRCARLIGSRFHFCTRHSTINRCIRCYNIHEPCTPIPGEFKAGFVKIQKLWQSGVLSSALEEREIWQRLVDNSVKTKGLPVSSSSKHATQQMTVTPSVKISLVEAINSLQREVQLQRIEARLHTNAVLHALGAPELDPLERETEMDSDSE